MGREPRNVKTAADAYIKMAPRKQRADDQHARKEEKFLTRLADGQENRDPRRDPIKRCLCGRFPFIDKTGNQQLYGCPKKLKLGYWVSCHKCGPLGPRCDTREEAAIAWNSVDL